MGRKHFVFAVAAVAGIVAMSSAGQSRTDHGCADHMDEGFESIFNGKDLDGWTGDTATYGVDPTEPGVLQCFPDRKSNGGSGNLVTKKEYGNFVLPLVEILGRRRPSRALPLGFAPSCVCRREQFYGREAFLPGPAALVRVSDAGEGYPRHQGRLCGLRLRRSGRRRTGGKIGDERSLMKLLQML